VVSINVWREKGRKGKRRETPVVKLKSVEK
jgi:hypothetical protein